MLGALLNHTVTVKRQTAVDDLAGGPVVSWPVLYADLPARVEDLGGDQVMELAQLGINASHRVFFDDDRAVNVRNGDAIAFEGILARVTKPNTRRALGGIGDYYVILVKSFQP